MRKTLTGDYTDRNISSYSPFHRGKEYFYKHTDLYGKEHISFGLSFIFLLDRVFISKNLSFLTPDQKKFVTEWLEEGNKKTDDEEYELDGYIRAFDAFLGKYRGKQYVR
jgi:hypothetical protein